MSWHYKFVAENKQEVGFGIDKHMAVVNSDFLCELTTKMRQAMSLLTDYEGVAWSVESFGHVGDQGCNFTFKVEPVNTTRNPFYRPAEPLPAPPVPEEKK